MKTTTWGRNRDLSARTASRQIALSLGIVTAVLLAVWGFAF